MSNKEKKMKAFSTLIISLLVIGIIFITLSGIQKWIGIGFFTVALILLIINSLGTFYYSKASRLLNGENPPVKDSLPIFEKAVKLGIETKGEVVVGTLFVQYGDMEKGKAILEGCLDSQDNKVVQSTKISLSMYYWIKNDLDKALSIAEEVYNTGFRDCNLYINLSTYYLEKGKYKEFKKLVKESKDKNFYLPATQDLEAAYYMTQSDWARAGSLLKNLFETSKPTFIDPFLHKALVLLHYGEWDEAAKALKELKEKCQFTNASIYTESQIDILIAYIEEEDTRWGLLEAINSDPAIFIRRELPTVKSGVPMPQSFPNKPDFSELEKTTTLIEDEEEDDGDIDTSLTDDDEEWIKKHS